MTTLAQRQALQERPTGRAVMHQRWEDLLFLHWEIEPSVIQQTLPAGLTVDCHEGKAYIAIVPFKMRAIRPAPLPAVPYLSNFLESNVRTYVRDEHGVPGVWFYSLDTDRWLAYWVARKFFSLPYVWSPMACQSIGSQFQYEITRRETRETSRFSFKPKSEAQVSTPGSLDFFMLERYLLYSFNKRKNQLFRGRVHHQPYEAAPVTLDDWDVKPIGWNHLPLPQGPPAHACYSQKVSVEVFPLQRA